jgi:hypothetical protein
MFERLMRLVALIALAAALLLPAQAAAAASKPALSLPTPRGETWKVIQGYNCGSHDGWGHLSFDIVNQHGRTRGAPVYAAADGTLFYWGASSGTLIIGHGAGYYTMYTPMQSHIDLPVGATIARGTQVGTVGSVGADYTVPHLHFTFFYGEGSYASSRSGLPLEFVEGYSFPEDGSCNQHAGALLTAGGWAEPAPAEVRTFPETGRSLSGSFLRFWEQNGGLPLFGYPITDAAAETLADSGAATTVQYTERQRFELAADGSVLLGRLGDELLRLQGRDWQSFPKADPQTRHYFPATGHAIAPEFWAYWRSHGLALFGLPLSEPGYETNPDGKLVLTQWFERVRLEYDPESATPVQLGRLGAEILGARGAG